MSLENEVEDISKWGMVDTWGEPILSYLGLKEKEGVITDLQQYICQEVSIWGDLWTGEVACENKWGEEDTDSRKRLCT